MCYCFGLVNFLLSPMPASLGALFPIPGFADPVSSLTHLLGAPAFLVVGIIAMRRSILAARAAGDSSQTKGRTTALALFTFGTVFLLSMSGVYHLLPRGPGRDVLQRLDHAAIFVLIAGSFTPIHAILFRGPFLRYGMLTLIWTIAIAGLTLKTVFFRSMPQSLGLFIYLGMGWLGIVSMIALWRSKHYGLAQLILFGGLAYTIGAITELLTPSPLVRGVIRAHEIFHIAVLFGLAFHWMAALKLATFTAPQPHQSRPDKNAR